MNKYKPEFLSKVLPVNDSNKLTDFVQNKYEAFSQIYDACKEQSDSINDIEAIDNSDGILSIRVDTDPESTRRILETVSENQYLSMSGNTITATGN